MLRLFWEISKIIFFTFFMVVLSLTILATGISLLLSGDIILFFVFVGCLLLLDLIITNE